MKNKLDTQSSFANGQANRNKPLMIFDWVNAAKIIVENDIKNALAGLDGDFEWTADQILKDGKPLSDGYSYLSSTWAKPILVDVDTEKEYPCYCMENNNPQQFHAKSHWNDAALEILKRGKQPKIAPKKAVPVDEKQVKELMIVEEKPMLGMNLDEDES